LAARVREALLRDDDDEPDLLRDELLRAEELLPDLARDEDPLPDLRVDELLRAEELRDDPLPDLRDDDAPEPLRDEVLRDEELRDDELRDDPPPDFPRDDPPDLDDPPLPPLLELRFESAISRSSSAPRYGRDYGTLKQASTGA
jgi:hypothetical protein